MSATLESIDHLPFDLADVIERTPCEVTVMVADQQWLECEQYADWIIWFRCPEGHGRETPVCNEHKNLINSPGARTLCSFARRIVVGDPRSRCDLDQTIVGIFPL